MGGEPEVQLGEIADLIRGVSYRPPDLLGPGCESVPLLRATNIGNRALELSDVLHVRSALVRDHQLLRRFDVVVAMSSGSREAVGRLAQLRRDWRGCVGAFCGVIRPVPERTDPAFLGYVLQSPHFRARIEAVAEGTAIMNLSRERILGYRLRLPTRPAQKGIAVILGALDDKIELNRRMSETLEAMARALFKSWFVDFDPVRAKTEGRDAGLPRGIADLFPDSLDETNPEPIPKGWRLGSITELQANRRYACVAGPFGSNLTSRDYTEGGVPVIRGANLSNESIWLRERDFVFVSDAKADSLSGCLAHPGDVVFTQRGTLGQVSVIPEDSIHPRFLLSQSQMKIAARPEAAAAFYIALYFRQQSVVDYIVANGQQAGVPHINLGFLRAFRVLLPPDEVLRVFDAIVRPLFQAVRARDLEVATLSALRDTLLPKLISGELRIPDAERIVREVA